MKTLENQAINDEQPHYSLDAFSLKQKYDVSAPLLDLLAEQSGIPRDAGGRCDVAWMAYFLRGFKLVREDAQTLTGAAVVLIGYMDAIRGLGGDTGVRRVLLPIFLRNGFSYDYFMKAFDEVAAYHEMQVAVFGMLANRNPHV